MENPGGAGLGGASLMRADCLRCFGVGYEFENLDGKEVVWMESAAYGNHIAQFNCNSPENLCAE